MNKGLRALLAGCGVLSVVLGFIGIFLPLLPTTPFLLLAAWLFAKSSTRLHGWLLNHPHLGSHIASWQAGKGMERKVRRRMFIFLWCSLMVSAIILSKLWSLLMLATIGACVTLFLLRQPVYDRP